MKFDFYLTNKQAYFTSLVLDRSDPELTVLDGKLSFKCVTGLKHYMMQPTDSHEVQVTKISIDSMSQTFD